MDLSKLGYAKMKVTALVWDKTLYPREDVSEQHVSNLTYALRMGEKLPNLLIEEKSGRLIDGVHRWKAARRVFGDESEIDCFLATFDSEEQAFLAAVAANATHGLRYSGFELTKIAIRADELGITRETLAQAVRIPLDKIEKRSISHIARGDVGGNEQRIALKGSMKALAGKKLTEGQMEANKHAGGMTATYYVNTIIELVEQGLGTKWGTEEARKRLIALRDLLQKKKLKG